MQQDKLPFSNRARSSAIREAVGRTLWVERLESRRLMATYYVSAGVADTGPGTSASPFKTIQEAANIAAPGDTVVIGSGRYRETVTPVNTGTATISDGHGGQVSGQITYQQAPGASVTIDGADPIMPKGAKWSVYTGATGAGIGHIFSIPLTVPVSSTSPNVTNHDQLQVFVDGVALTDARFPNTPYGTTPDIMRPNLYGFDTVSAVLDANGNKVIDAAGSEYWQATSTKFAADIATYGASFFVGATIHGRGQTFTINDIQPDGTFHFYIPVNAPQDASPPVNGGDPGFFVTRPTSQGLNYLDTSGEYFQDPSTNTLYVWTSDGQSPVNHKLRVRTRNSGFDLAGFSYTTLQGLNFFSSTVRTDTASTHIVIDGCNLRYLSNFGNDTVSRNQGQTNTGLVMNGSDSTVKNSTVVYSAASGIFLVGENDVATNNIVHDINYRESGSNGGIAAIGKNQTISYNSIYNTGIEGIFLGGANQGGGGTIVHNDVWNCGLLGSDFGIIYTVRGNGTYNGTKKTRIAFNRLHDSSVFLPGGFENNAKGIYLDNGSSNFVVDHNLIYNVRWGIDLNTFLGTSSNTRLSQGDEVYNNTVLNTTFRTASQNYSPMPQTFFINNIFAGASTSTRSEFGPGSTISNNLFQVDPFYNDTPDPNKTYSDYVGTPAGVIDRSKQTIPNALPKLDPTTFVPLTGSPAKGTGVAIATQGLNLAAAGQDLGAYAPSVDANGQADFLGNNGFGANLIPSGIAAAWSDGDIGTVSTPGYSTQFGVDFALTGSGTGTDKTTGKIDSAHFTYRTLIGDAAASAEVVALNNVNNTVPSGQGVSNNVPTGTGGVMFRNSTAANSVFFGLFVQQQPNGTSSVIATWRTATGVAVTSSTPMAVGGPVHLRITRTGSTLKAMYSADGVNWSTVAGTPTTLPALSTTVQAGVSHSSTSAPSTGYFADVGVSSKVPPSIVRNATAATRTVTNGSTVLSVLASNGGSESDLTYTWKTSGPAPAPVFFTQNGTNDTSTLPVIFSKIGLYTFVVRIADPDGNAIQSSVSVSVISLVGP